MRSILTYVEADLPRCSLVYGTAPCAAVLGTAEEVAAGTATGTKKCLNTPATCQDRTNYDEVGVTVRWAQDTGNLPAEIDAIPSITGVSFTPATISLGENLGQRATLSVTFKDHPDSDTGPAGDPYIADRAYSPFNQGTFWGKFRSRQPFLRGRAIRLIRGELGQTLAEMETRHFILESSQGPSPDGSFTLEAKDALKMADNDRAQAPLLSNGFLVTDIDADDTAATLSPSGIGNAEYPASGHVAIGGTEIVSFIRSADVLTITRAQHGTVGVAHKAQDRVQLCLVYAAEDPADIIADLFENYASVPSAYIPIAAWQAETDAYLRRVYSAVIAEPTGVNTLISELVQQCALAIWWDDIGQQLRLKVLRLIPTDADLFDRSNTMKGSLRIQEQPDKRISQVQVLFGQINPLKKVDDADNYRSSVLNWDPEAEEDYGTPAIKRIYARWIAAGGRTVAQRVGDIQLGRFRDPPRRFSLSLFRQEGATAPVLGQGYQIEAQPLQTDEGAADTVPLQITRLNPGAGKFDVEAEEMRFISFDEGDLDNRVIIIDADEFNVNFRTKHDLLYPTPVSGDEVTLIVEAGVKVGSTLTSLPAFDVGSWPAGVILNLDIRGRIQGRGGIGAAGSTGGGQPGDGGTALYARFAVNVTVSSGEIFSGGGGGAFLNPSSALNDNIGGGGGQGYLAGAGGPAPTPGFPGTSEAPGLRGDGSSAGAGGAAGLPGVGTVHGAAGTAIDGVSYLTIVAGPGDIRGPQVN